MVVSATFILEGQVAPKKNSRQLFVKNGRMINIPSKRYKAWHDDVMMQLKGVRSFNPPYEIIMTFWFKDKRRKDLDNSLASVLDLLQDAQIIQDDDAKLLPRITAIYGGVSKECPRVKVELHSEIDHSGNSVSKSDFGY